MSYNPPFYKRFFHSTRRIAAAVWLNMMPALQIGITGSQGKTNTTQVLYSLLSSISPTVVTDIDLDSTYNIPITSLKVMPWTRYAIFEMGIDHPGEMDGHLKIIRPKIAIITGISPVHTDLAHLGSLQNLINEKSKLIGILPKNGFAILNYDDENVRKMAALTRAKILWYGSDPRVCDIWVDPNSIKISLGGTEFILNSKNLVKMKIKSNLIGKHHIYTIMSSLLVVDAINKLTHLEINVSALIERLYRIKPLEGRMSVEEGPEGTKILNDSLRANPTSTTSGLLTLSELQIKARKIAVLAEMGELQHPEEEHKKIGRLIPKLKIDYLFAIGPMQKYVVEEAIKNGFPKDKVFWTSNIHESIPLIKRVLRRGDLIYLKGSLLRHLERVPMLLKDEKVNCNVVICPFYNNCSVCKYRYVGYQNKKA